MLFYNLFESDLLEWQCCEIFQSFNMNIQKITRRKQKVMLFDTLFESDLLEWCCGNFRWEGTLWMSVSRLLLFHSIVVFPRCLSLSLCLSLCLSLVFLFVVFLLSSSVFVSCLYRLLLVLRVLLFVFTCPSSLSLFCSTSVELPVALLRLDSVKRFRQRWVDKNKFYF